MQTLYVSDVTLRMQQERADCALSFKEKLEIAKALDRLGPDCIELGQIADARVDALLVKSIAAVVTHSGLALPVALSTEGVDAAWQALHEAKRPRLQIAVPTSTVQMEYLCHKKPDALLALVSTLVSHAKSLCGDVEFVALDATRSDPAFLARAVETACGAGVNTVTLCDTAGVMLPDEFAAFVKNLRQGVPALAGCVLYVQCADTLSLSAACSVAAVAAGAQGVKVAAVDEDALFVEALCDILRVRGADLGVSAGVRMTELGRIVKQIDWITHAKRSAMTPFDSGVGGAGRVPQPSGWTLDASSTPTEVLAAVQRLGYDLSAEDGGKVYETFARNAAKKNVGEKELEAIVASVALQVPPTYAIKSYVINSGNVITATAHVKLEKAGEALSGIGLGDGPIDASFLAIEQIVGHHYELDDFQIQAVTEGREAMGSALVRLRSNGRLYSGKGISTDIIGASIHAYVNALNKIVYEETVRA